MVGAIDKFAEALQPFINGKVPTHFAAQFRRRRVRQVAGQLDFVFLGHGHDAFEEIGGAGEDLVAVDLAAFMGFVVIVFGKFP